jgi:hypothetical protein
MPHAVEMQKDLQNKIGNDEVQNEEIHREIYKFKFI